VLNSTPDSLFGLPYNASSDHCSTKAVTQEISDVTYVHNGRESRSNPLLVSSRTLIFMRKFRC